MERRVVAVYLFHSSGDPLVALASGRTFAIEAEKMQAILSAVGGFVEKSMSALPTYAVTGLRFDEQGVLAVRGRHLIAAVVYLGPAYDAVRSELTRVVRDLEKRHSRDLETWESAVSIAEAGADALGKLLARPQ
ncbi:MAG: hypothetical protein A3K68_03340 [Euryarchaeota archaeon RBG_16_68_13]|nr:MAG: hypothetical protein A3K68_03340 [Euryarchaeota archaeon RBG_16_68_13]